MGNGLSFQGEAEQLLEWLRMLAPTLLISILCGGLIGIERQLKNKAAGVKTNILICVGAALYAALSVLISQANVASGGPPGDPSRIAAQVVSGIGFLGGGAIIHARGIVVGLTTAATIWVVAAIGLLIGVGYPVLGIVSAVTVVLILVLTNIFEDKVLGRTTKYHLDLTLTDSDGKLRHIIQELMLTHELVLEDFVVSTMGEAQRVELSYSGARVSHTKLMGDLWSLTGVKEVRQR